MKRRDTPTVRFHTIQDTHSVRVVWGHRVKNRFPRHTHSVFCLGIVDRGKRVISQRRATTIIPEGHVFVLNPGESHACASLDEQGHSYRIVCLQTDFLQSVASRLSGKTESIPYFGDTLVHDHELVKLMNRFFSSLEPGASLLRQQSCLLSLCARLVFVHATDAPVPFWSACSRGSIEQAREYIEAHFPENLSLEELARISGLSPFHFQRVFVSRMGVSPHEYLLQFRLRKAREYLRDGLSLADTALETGFVDQSHFTRRFKRAVGIPPGQYLRLHHQKDPDA